MDYKQKLATFDIAFWPTFLPFALNPKKMVKLGFICSGENTLQCENCGQIAKINTKMETENAVKTVVLRLMENTHKFECKYTQK